MSDDEETPSLSADTLAALQSFLVEKEEAEKKFAELQAQAEADFDQVKVDISAFGEDYQLSQFWYDEGTQLALVTEVASECPQGNVAFLSTPSAYFKARSMRADNNWEWTSTLFEFDNRFRVGAGNEFVFFDYSEPGAIPPRLHGTFDLLVVDPPFLSEECWLKFAIVIKKLAKPGAKVIVCTGMVMRDFLRRILPDLRLSRFKIVHQDSRLSNDFACLVNYCSQDSAFAFIDE